MGVTWKTILVIVLALILIVVGLILIFEVFGDIPGKFSGMLEQLDRAMKSLFDAFR